MILCANKTKVSHGKTLNKENSALISFLPLKFQLCCIHLGSKRIFQYLLASTKKSAELSKAKSMQVSTNTPTPPIDPNGFVSSRKMEKVYIQYICLNLSTKSRFNILEFPPFPNI